MSALSRQWRRFTWTLLTGAAVATSQPAPSDGEVLDRVVAVVRVARNAGGDASETVITLSDLRFEAAIAFIQRGGTQAATADLNEEALAGALEYAISQRLHAQEAEKLRAFSIQQSEIDAAEADLLNKLGSAQALDRFLERHDMPRADLRRVLARNLLAARALDSRIRLRAQVGESETRRQYDQLMEQSRTEGTTLPPYEQLRPGIREMLFRERYNALAKAETQELREQADVRILASFAVGEGT